MYRLHTNILLLYNKIIKESWKKSKGNTLENKPNNNLKRNVFTSFFIRSAVEYSTNNM
jgi:hypothetical protein